jgi:hypothetical protein
VPGCGRASYAEARVACHPGRDRIEDRHERGHRGLRVEVLPELAAGLAVGEQGLDGRVTSVTSLATAGLTAASPGEPVMISWNATVSARWVAVYSRIDSIHARSRSAAVGRVSARAETNAPPVAAIWASASWTSSSFLAKW